MKMFAVVYIVIILLCNQTVQAQHEMVLMPAGNYLPLYRQDTGLNQIRVKAFMIDRYAVTNQDYLAFVQAHPEWQKENVRELFADQNYLRKWAGNSFDPAIAESPVTNVSWFAAKKYCEARGKRLPTVDEWEYSAAASATRANAAGDDAFYQVLLEMYSQPTPKHFPPVDESFKNFYGLYGIHGQVWEWVLDFNSVLLSGESRANMGNDRDLFCAGGSIGADDTKNYVAFLRYAFRSSLKASYTTNNLGFRCACDVPFSQTTKR